MDNTEGKEKNKVSIFIRPEAFKRMKDENKKTIGISVSGYQSPDGKYYNVEIPFKEDKDISVRIVQKGTKFKGWAVVTAIPNVALTMVNKEEKVYLDLNAFKSFIEHKNRKVQPIEKSKGNEL